MQPDLFDLGRLQDMLVAARIARDYLGERTLDQFVADRILCDAIERRVEIIGEAESRVSSGCRARHPQIPWRQIVATRNILVHNYAAVDHTILHRIVVTHLPDMIAQIEAILPPPPPDPLSETTEGGT